MTELGDVEVVQQLEVVTAGLKMEKVAVGPKTGTMDGSC